MDPTVPGDDVTTALLHNMSARPRTPVTYKVPAMRRDWVSFTWQQPHPPFDTPTFDRLDDAWRATGLRGAVIIHRLTVDLSRRVRLTRCSEADLVLNVLLRARGSLLLADMPLIDEPSALDGDGLTTDDPRMVELVRGSR